MKFFKFDVNVYDFDELGSKHFLETHYINIEEIKEIIVSSNIVGEQFIVRTRSVFSSSGKIENGNSINNYLK